MEKMKKLEIKERVILFNKKEIKDGTFIRFYYGKKCLEYGGYFYIADVFNRMVGCDFMISEIKRENWKFWSWDSGYLKGFKISKVHKFKIGKGKIKWKKNK